MPSNIPLISNKNKELLNRLMILEKFIELKSNECAYYRSKVHLMQMSPINSQIKKKLDSKCSSEDNSSIDNTHPTSSVPLSSQQNSILKQRKFSSRSKKNLNLSNSSIPFSSSPRRHKKGITYAQNQNYYEETLSKDNYKLHQNLLSYINKHIQQVVSQDKNIQCNDNDIQTSPQTVLMIRLPRRFVKSLGEQQNKSSTPKLKVQISSELLNKLFQSIHTKTKHQQSDKFTIQSQFGSIAACIHNEDSIAKQDSRAVQARIEVKTRLPTIRHIARTRSEDSNRKMILAENNLHTNSHKHRRKKRHLHKSISTFSKRSSLTNVTLSSNNNSSNQTSNSIK